MRLEINVSMDYQTAPKEAVLLILEAARMPGQSVIEEALEVQAATLRRVPAGAAGPGNGNGQVWAMLDGSRLALSYRALVHISRPDTALEGLAAGPLHSLPPEALEALRPSRYCQSDLFETLAATQFGHLEGGAKIAAMAAWVQAEIRYVPGSSDGSTSAADTLAARAGVCRDFAHVLCSLARAAMIPARYVSVYGPDIDPPDFHAVAQVWLGGAWHLVDATAMGRPSQLAVIAAGRDAADVAFMETANWAQLNCQTVTVTPL